MQEQLVKPWHQLPESKVMALLAANRAQGLDPLEAEQRRARFGRNTITAKAGRGPLIRFLLQFHQPLIYILIASGTITALLQEWVDAGVIFGVVVMNALVGYIQEAKAVNALAALARTMVTEALVLRQGEKRRLAATELVPGDLVYLQSGDKVPADLRLIQVRDLQIAEAALTGESLAVAKQSGEVAPATPLADRANMAYASTFVTYGQGLGVVTAIGNATEVGRISRLIATTEELATPLTRKISHFSTVLLYIILGLAALTVVVGVLRGQPPIDMFMAAVALAVGAIPEGLPAAVTITLAIGVGRMAKRRAIIRRLPAVETLGSTTVICTDKTGTLTENQMTVQEIWANGVLHRVMGGGYNPAAGLITPAGASVDDADALRECLLAGMHCNDSQLREQEGVWLVQGDPTEGALLVAARKGGLDPEQQLAALPRLDTIPFESQHQYMATLHGPGGPGEPRTVYVKGGVEAVLARCPLTEDGQAEVAAQVQTMAAQGQRVLALAKKELPAGQEGISHGDVEAGLSFLGLQAMIDPPRAEAVAAVRICRAAGILVKMITGDHAVTAGAIARQVGLGNDGGEATVATLSGQQLDLLSDAELAQRVEETVVFARATPEQKLRLVMALQAQGHVVAMTGDGVNDAPALKRADIGVAMGITGTEVAKEAAAMVLADDNFSSIEAAVEEGRGVFDNLTKFIVWTLPTNLGEGLVILCAVLLGLTMPILPLQILWINMTTAGFLGLALAFEPKEPGIMQRRPRDPKAPILPPELLLRVGLVSGLMLISAFLLFRWELTAGATLEEARTVAVNVFVVVELCYLLNCRSLDKGFFQLPLFGNPLVYAGILVMLGAQGLYTYTPIMNRLFQSTPINAAAWGRIAVAGGVVFALIEVEKMAWRLWRRGRK